MNRLSLAAQIAKLVDSAPADFDPEDAYAEGRAIAEDDSDQLENAVGGGGGRDHYLDVGPSRLRRVQDISGDLKYKGLKTSRAKIFDDDDDNEMVLEENDLVNRDNSPDMPSPNGQDQPSQASRNLEERESAVSTEDEDEDSREEDEDGTRQDSEVNGEHEQHPTTMGTDQALADALKTTREQDRLKGKAVVRQQALWDSLLDARIRVKKAVMKANSLPLPSNIGPYVSTDIGQQSARSFLNETLKLSEDLFELRETLLSSNEDVSLPPRKKRKIVEETDEADPAYESQVVDVTSDLASLESAYHANLVQTLNKWSAKVQAVAPSALLTRPNTAFSRSSKTAMKTAVQLIDETLEEGKALTRTKVRRSGKTSDRIGVEVDAGGDPVDHLNEVDEVFDDVDFYQQLLRDVIDSRTGKEDLGLGDGDAWSIKSKKTKRKTDSRESKGRKLRYEVHEKIQNFMVPVPARGAWHEEQIDELFASLLGKGFEGTASEDVTMRATENVPEHFLQSIDGDLAGLRVF